MEHFQEEEEEEEEEEEVEKMEERYFFRPKKGKQLECWLCKTRRRIELVPEQEESGEDDHIYISLHS